MFRSETTEGIAACTLAGDTRKLAAGVHASGPVGHRVAHPSSRVRLPLNVNVLRECCHGLPRHHPDSRAASSSAATLYLRRPRGMSSDLRRRPAPAQPVDDVIEDDEDDAQQPSNKPMAWHEYTMVRVVLVLLALFGVMHLFLWKWVYDIAMEQNHDRLRGSVREAIDSLYRVVDHL